MGPCAPILLYRIESRKNLPESSVETEFIAQREIDLHHPRFPMHVARAGRLETDIS